MSTTGDGWMGDDQGPETVEELDLEPVVTAPRRPPRALWAALAAVALAAGGLVISSAGDDGGQRPALPVDLAAAMRAGGATEAAADAMLAWVVYVPGDDLPALGGEATAYRVRGDVDEARVRELAAAVGLGGDVQQGSDRSWSVTGDGGAGRLDVRSGPGAYWSYVSGYQDCVHADGGVGGCSNEECVTKGDVTECTVSAVGTAAGGGAGAPGCDDNAYCAATTTTSCDAPCPIDCVPSCSPPPPGIDTVPSVGTTPSCAADECAAPDVQASPASELPDEAEARRVAIDVVSATGTDVDGARVEAMPGAGTWRVTVEPLLDGVPSGLQSSVEVGSELRVLSGFGVFGAVETLGQYPVLDTRATIERANDRSSSVGGIEPAIGSAADAGVATGGSSSGTGGTGTGDTGAGDAGTVGEPSTTIITQCAAADDPSGGCVGTTGCGGDGCIEPGVASPCEAQPDGKELCAHDCALDATIGQDGGTTGGGGTVGGDASIAVEPCPEPTCPQSAPPADAGADPAAPTCAPPTTVPVPEPGPAEVVLVDAVRSLLPLPANDGSHDVYLVPAYRFTVDGGGTVDLPAVAEEALAGPVTTETTEPDTVVPPPVPVPQPLPCGTTLEEQDPESATTLTVPSCPPSDAEPRTLGDGERPALDVGYYVDVDRQCAGGSFLLGDQVWVSSDDAPSTWGDTAERHEGGTFTLDAADHGTFVGDADGAKVGEFRLVRANEDLFCAPQPR
ncbi:MAG: hypothetical protein ACJ739_16010 [Acidimicrobiales bacterium]